MEFFDLKTFYTILHLVGVVLGAGGAYMSDAIFLLSTKDRKINKTEFDFMRLGSGFVWAGLVIIFISGILLFLTDPSGYMASEKFLLKMFIVFIIFINGLFFHFYHMPIISRHTDHHYPSSDEFMRKKKLLMISGVVSITSWTFAIILGSLDSLPVGLISALVLYIVFEILCIIFAIKFFKESF